MCVTSYLIKAVNCWAHQQITLTCLQFPGYFSSSLLKILGLDTCFPSVPQHCYEPLQSLLSSVRFQGSCVLFGKMRHMGMVVSLIYLVLFTHLYTWVYCGESSEHSHLKKGLLPAGVQQGQWAGMLTCGPAQLPYPCMILQVKLNIMLSGICMHGKRSACTMRLSSHAHPKNVFGVLSAHQSRFMGHRHHTGEESGGSPLHRQTLFCASNNLEWEGWDSTNDPCHANITGSHALLFSQ